MTVLLAVIGAGVMTCAAAGTAWLRGHAGAWGLMDVPNERSLHDRATPRGGGMVVVLVVLGGLIAVTLGSGLSVLPILAYIGAALIVAAIGWQDDRRSVSPALRFVTHAVAALAALATWGVIDRLHLPGLGLLALSDSLALVGTLLWIVGLLNAYNFMDGIDGLASGQAVLGGTMWVLLCATGVPLVAAIAALTAAASLGFLWHNWAPAKIFMGDSGSGFLGFTFAVLPLIAFQATGDARFPAAGVLVVAPFVFDTLYTFARRLLRGENVIRAHRTHLYQRLVLNGWSHAAVAALYLSLATLCGAAAVGWLRGLSGWILLAPAAMLVLLPGLVAWTSGADK